MTAKVVKEDIITNGDEPGIPTRIEEPVSPVEKPQLLKEAFSQTQKATINQLTPPKYIKTRPGRGGMNFSYVEVGYIINVLNEVFGHYWDWEIEDQQIGKDQVWVKGKLTINSFSDVNRKIIKSSFGGSAIKKNASTGEAIDIADDLKAASADALKKAASLLGVAADVYFPNMDRIEE